MVHRDDLLVVCMSVRLSVSQFVDLFLRGRGQGGRGQSFTAASCTSLSAVDDTCDTNHLLMTQNSCYTIIRIVNTCAGIIIHTDNVLWFICH